MLPVLLFLLGCWLRRVGSNVASLVCPGVCPQSQFTVFWSTRGYKFISWTFLGQTADFRLGWFDLNYRVRGMVGYFITPFYRHILISRPQSPCLLLFPASVAAVRYSGLSRRCPLFRPQSPLFVYSGLSRRCSFIPASVAAVRLFRPQSPCFYRSNHPQITPKSRSTPFTFRLLISEIHTVSYFG